VHHHNSSLPSSSSAAAVEAAAAAARAIGHFSPVGRDSTCRQAARRIISLAGCSGGTIGRYSVVIIDRYASA